MTPPTTLHLLLRDHKVVIPIFQRDFAQGRRDDKTAQVRREFLQAISEALESHDGSSLDLGLVFGAISQGELQLVDGQQRLTALFLVHWYLSRKCGIEWGSEGCFTYETRSSAGDFCQALLREPFIVTHEAPDIVLRNKPWFRSDWEKDPTVDGMLVVLGAIHSNPSFRVMGAAHWDRLTGKSPAISFIWSDMGSGAFDSIDAFYLKMNSRGKGLTTFEKFKAWLEDLVDTDSSYIELKAPEWSRKIDKEWTDLFWKRRNDNKTDDYAMFRFFTGCALTHLCSHSEVKSDLIQRVNNRQFLGTDDLRILFTPKTTAAVFQTLDGLTGVQRNMDQVDASLGGLAFFFRSGEPSLFGRFISESDSTLGARLLFHALCVFLRTGHTLADDALASWMRLIRNLVENTPVTADNFAALARLISNLGDNGSKDLQFQWLEGLGEIGKAANFDNDQISEEILKAKLIRGNIRWEELIHRAEDHPVFRGQIGFMIRMANGDPTEFMELHVFFSLIFDPEDTSLRGKAEGYLLHRCLLTFGDYLQADHPVHRFGHDDNDWRRILRAIATTPSGESIRSTLSQLRKAAPHPSVEKFRSIIHGWLENPDKDPKQCWRYFLIATPAAFAHRYFYWPYDHDEGALIFTGENRRGWYLELGTLFLHHRPLEKSIKNLKLGYHQAYGIGGRPCCIAEIGSQRFEISFQNESKAYVIREGANIAKDGIGAASLEEEVTRFLTEQTELTTPP